MQAHDIGGSLAGAAALDFRVLEPFNNGTVGTYWSAAGVSPWERHPDDDELLLIIDGSAEIEVMTEDETVVVEVRAGSFFVVPRGHWHRHRITESVRELYVTPGPSDTSFAEDPRR